MTCYAVAVCFIHAFKMIRGSAPWSLWLDVEQRLHGKPDARGHDAQSRGILAELREVVTSGGSTGANDSGLCGATSRIY